MLDQSLKKEDSLKSTSSPVIRQTRNTTQTKLLSTAASPLEIASDASAFLTPSPAVPNKRPTGRHQNKPSHKRGADASTVQESDKVSRAEEQLEHSPRHSNAPVAAIDTPPVVLIEPIQQTHPSPATTGENGKTVTMKQSAPANQKSSSPRDTTANTRSYSGIVKTLAFSTESNTTPPLDATVPGSSDKVGNAIVSSSTDKPTPDTLEEARRRIPLKVPEGHKLVHIMRHFRSWQK